MQTIKHAVIAAAGMGTRLGLGFPKCLYKLGGKPLIVHLLELLKNVEDVRVVVGYMENQVIETVRSIRSDIIFVRNPSYQSTTTLTSYFLGAENISGPCLFMDADIYFTTGSFESFCRKCSSVSLPCIAVTQAKTVDAVYVTRGLNGSALSFSREVATSWEWANLAYLPAGTLENKNLAVFDELKSKLPMSCLEVESYEIDCIEDLKIAKAAFKNAEATQLK